MIGPRLAYIAGSPKSRNLANSLGSASVLLWVFCAVASCGALQSACGAEPAPDRITIWGASDAALEVLCAAGIGDSRSDLPPSFSLFGDWIEVSRPEARSDGGSPNPSAYAPGTQKLSLAASFSAIITVDNGETSDTTGFFSAVEFSYGYFLFRSTEVGLSVQCPQMADSDSDDFWGILNIEAYVKRYFVPSSEKMVPYVLLHGGIGMVSGENSDDTETGGMVGVGAGVERMLSAATSFFVQCDFTYTEYPEDFEVLALYVKLGMSFRF